MINHYSVAIYPSDDLISIVKSMKSLLANKIDWFHSKNSTAHITIFEFKATDTTIEIIKNQLDKLCDALEPFEVRLNEFGSYPNGAFFIAPSEDSKNKLKKMMKQFHQSFKIPGMKKSSDPHLSIARKLSPENLDIAKRLFTTIDQFFMCKEVVLRKFDEKLKQFTVIDTFEFNSNPKPEFVQGSLF